MYEDLHFKIIRFDRGKWTHNVLNIHNRAQGPYKNFNFISASKKKKEFDINGL